LIDIFDDPLFTPFVPFFAGEPLDKRHAINQLSKRYASFAPLMDKIRNSSTPQLLNTLEDSVRIIAENPVQGAANDVLRLLDDAKIMVPKLKVAQAYDDSVVEYGRVFGCEKMDELMKVRCVHRFRKENRGTCPQCFEVKLQGSGTLRR
jgi:hypothetical protein